MLGQIALITLGVLVITSEYGTGMIRTTFTASPQRYRVLAAKALVFFAARLRRLGAVLASRFVGLMASSIAQRPRVSAAPVAAAGRSRRRGLYVSLLGLLSLAVGTMLRHSAGAITAMLGVVLLPAILPAFLLMSDSTRTIRNKLLEYTAPNVARPRSSRSDDGGSTGCARSYGC